MLVQTLPGELPVDAGLLLLPIRAVGELPIDGPPLPGELRGVVQIEGPVIEGTGTVVCGGGPLRG